MLLYFIALHPHRDRDGVKHLGISAPYAAFFGVIAAFERALQYARNIDPALSGDAASYHLAQFRFQNEIFQDAELGATVERVDLDVFF